MEVWHTGGGGGGPEKSTEGQESSELYESQKSPI